MWLHSTVDCWPEDSRGEENDRMCWFLTAVDCSVEGGGDNSKRGNGFMSNCLF
jgi:hypothetical protein